MRGHVWCEDSKDQAHWCLSRVIAQTHRCMCVLQCVLDANCKEFTVVASWMHQISNNFEKPFDFSCLMACVHLPEEPGGGVGMRDVTRPPVSPSLLSWGFCQLSCFGKISLSPYSEPLQPHSCAEPPGCLVPGYLQWRSPWCLPALTPPLLLVCSGCCTAGMKWTSAHPQQRPLLCPSGPVMGTSHSSGTDFYC